MAVESGNLKHALHRNGSWLRSVRPIAPKNSNKTANSKDIVKIAIRLKITSLNDTSTSMNRQHQPIQARTILNINRASNKQQPTAASGLDRALAGQQASRYGILDHLTGRTVKVLLVVSDWMKQRPLEAWRDFSESEYGLHALLTKAPDPAFTGMQWTGKTFICNQQG